MCDCVRPNIHARSCKFNHQKGSKRHLTSSHSARRGPTSSLRRDLSPVPSRSSQSSPSEKLHPRDSLPKRKVSASVCSLNSLNCWKYCVEGIWRAGDWCCSGFLNVMECYWIILEITVTQPWPARLTSQTSRGRRCHRRKVGSNVASNDSRSGSTGPHLALHTFQLCKEVIWIQMPHVHPCSSMFIHFHPFPSPSLWLYI